MATYRNLGLILALTAVILSSGCCCCCSPDALPIQPFTPGDFPDIPGYPGAEQSTGQDSTFGLTTLPFQLLTEDVEWKHYITGDTKEAVLDWYAAEMVRQGWVNAADAMETRLPTEDALIFARADDPGLLAIIMLLPDPEGADRAHILIGRMRVPIED